MSKLVPYKTRRSLFPEESRELTSNKKGWWGNNRDVARTEATARSIAAQTNLLNELERFYGALTRLDRAELERGRAACELEDADKVYEYDRGVREKKYLQGEIELMDTQISHKKKKDELARVMNGSSRSVPRAEDAVIIEENDEELAAFRKDQAKTRNVFETALSAEDHVQQYIKNHGGWDNLAPEQKALVKKMREAIEQGIKESGFG